MHQKRLTARLFPDLLGSLQHSPTFKLDLRVRSRDKGRGGKRQRVGDRRGREIKGEGEKRRRWRGDGGKGKVGRKGKRSGGEILPAQSFIKVGTYAGNYSTV